LKLFAGLASQGKTIVMITHEADYGRFANNRLTLKDGKLAYEVSHD
jgi:ABC-type lipoprotein export system ATPase subunit